MARRHRAHKSARDAVATLIKESGVAAASRRLRIPGWKILAFAAHGHGRAAVFSAALSREAEADRVFIDALRTFMGLSPLHSADYVPETFVSYQDPCEIARR